MWEWLEVHENLQGNYLSELAYNHSPIYLGLFADIPDTWQMAGRIYFIDTTNNENLLLGTENIFFNMVHKAEFTFTNNYNILFKPQKYLDGYILKIGTNI